MVPLISQGSSVFHPVEKPKKEDNSAKEDSKWASGKGKDHKGV